jgi:hypothetical protein
MNDGFFADPSKVFLHGLLGPERVGTCSSLPVLYVAVGRQLGYPLKLVTAKGHLFVRWEGAESRAGWLWCGVVASLALSSEFSAGRAASDPIW